MLLFLRRRGSGVILRSPGDTNVASLLHSPPCTPERKEGKKERRKEGYKERRKEGKNGVIE